MNKWRVVVATVHSLVVIGLPLDASRLEHVRVCRIKLNLIRRTVSVSYIRKQTVCTCGIPLDSDKPVTFKVDRHAASLKIQHVKRVSFRYIDRRLYLQRGVGAGRVAHLNRTIRFDSGTGK